MTATSASGPDLSRCFGRYREQSVQYALQHCLECRKLKACVRTVWGMDQPRRTPRGAYQPGGRGRRGSRPPWPSEANPVVGSMAT
jgi:hypothetical protein